ncbi:MAG TPA: Fe-S-containing protein [Thermodesulfobacteriota bacterium]|nr:Fe-S-containing protein [Thermodesulfobacteriota bacterium]
MKACSKCQTKNQDSSQFCKKCGIKLSDSTFQDKKEKVLGEKKGKFSWGAISLAVAAIVVLAGFAYWLIQNNTVSDPRVSSQPKVSGNVNYNGQKISMTDVPAKLENGKISIPVGAVLEKKIVRFEYEGNGAKVPLLSYVTQTGKLVTAVSMCEPCRSTRFHIRDKTLVCNACGTEWNLETLKGIQGGCLNYPPDVIPSTIEKEKIQIDEKIVTQWKPRV